MFCWSEWVPFLRMIKWWENVVHFPGVVIGRHVMRMPFGPTWSLARISRSTFRNAAPPQRWGDRRVAKGRSTSKTLDIVVAACRAHAISAEETAEVPSSTCILRHWQAKAVVTTLIRLRFDCNSTALQPLDYLRYDRTPTCAWLLHCGLNKLCGRPPQYALPPASWPLTSWPWKWCPNHMCRGLPLCQF